MRQNIKRFGYLGALVSVFLLLNIMVLKTALGAEEKFPTRPVELIVPAPPGGGTDLISRFIADLAQPFLGQKVVVINKPGASATIGLNAIAEARKDGYTVGCVWAAPLTVVPQVLKVSFTLDDFSYLTVIAKSATVFCVLSEFPAKTAAEFFEYARKNPGKLTYANDGVGNAMHFTGERIFRAMKVKLRPVPYAGAGESIKALLGGHVDVYAGTVPPAIPHIEAGTIRAIFVPTKERIEALPDVPGLSDLGIPEVGIISWRGILGPKGIPADRLTVLEKAFRQAAQTQKMKEYLKSMGETAMTSSGREYEEMVRSQFAAMAIAAKEIGLAPK